MPSKRRSSTHQDSRQKPARFRRTVRRTWEGRYLVYLPDGYTTSKRWPVVLFLHGSGETGSDLEQVKKNGPPGMVEEGHAFPFILISPQNPAGDFWDVNQLSALVDEILATYPVDRRRFYLTGLSMGGYGAWALAIERPEVFAAIAPICGGGAPWMAERIRHLPVWTFHGARDRVVPIDETRRMVRELKSLGGSVRFTTYPRCDHDAWTRTYENPKFWDWLLAQRRPR